MSKKPFTVAYMRDIDEMIHKEEISYSRMVELLNEKAQAYAEHKVNEYKNHPLNKMIYDRGKEVISEELKQIPEGIYGDVTVEEYFELLNQKK